MELIGGAVKGKFFDASFKCDLFINFNLFVIVIEYVAASSQFDCVYQANIFCCNICILLMVIMVGF